MVHLELSSTSTPGYPLFGFYYKKMLIWITIDIPEGLKTENDSRVQLRK